MPFTWEKLALPESPPARIYHTSTYCSSGKNIGQLFIFGGRGISQASLSDIWSFKRFGKERKWQWSQVGNSKTKTASGRYQHSALCIGKNIVIIGGRNNVVEEQLNTDIYNTETQEWSIITPLGRFRHATWTNGNDIFTFGGFEQTAPNISVSKLVQLQIIKNSIDPGTPPPIIAAASTILNNFEDAKNVAENLNKSFAKSNTKSNELGYGIIPKLEKTKTDFSLILGYKEPRLSPTALIAMSFTTDLPPDQQKTVKVIAINRLQEESKKLLPESKEIKIFPNLYDTKENIVNMFLNCLMRPKEWSMEKTPENFMFKTECVIELVHEFINVVAAQPIVLKLNTPVKIFGDIHGQYQDLMRYFDLWRGPIDSSLGGDIDSYDYLFLGDYVDHGLRGLETVCLLMALKIKYPNQIHLLRGNHEDISINGLYGFGEECVERLNEHLDDPESAYKQINQAFDYLPLVAVIEEKIICMHGGLGENLFFVDDLNSIKRPLTIPKNPKKPIELIISEILWADPANTDEDIGIFANPARDPDGSRQVHRFGPDKVEAFLQANKADFLIRSHECVMDGIERYAKGNLLTVFTAPGYCGRFKNAGAMLVLQKDFEIVPKLIYPLDKGSGFLEAKMRRFSSAS